MAKGAAGSESDEPAGSPPRSVLPIEPPPPPWSDGADAWPVAGSDALGVGGDLVNAAALRDGNLAKITQAARELVLAVRSARELAPAGTL